MAPILSPCSAMVLPRSLMVRSSSKPFQAVIPCPRWPYLRPPTRGVKLGIGFLRRVTTPAIEAKERPCESCHLGLAGPLLLLKGLPQGFSS